MTVYICEDSLDGILCGVYDAWMSWKGHAQVKLQLDGWFEQELFTEYLTVPREMEKAEKVVKSIRQKISEEAYEKVYVASLSQDPDRADKIYRFLIYGFHFGKKVVDMLQIPAVFQLFQMCRNVYNENHLLIEFIRFSQITDRNLMFSRIAPKNRVLSLLAPHFSDRFPGERWIIYDENRQEAAVYLPGRGWAILQPDPAMRREIDNWQTDSREYEDLWKIFHGTIAIKERFNPKCQRNHLPLRFRGYMTEFQ